MKRVVDTWFKKGLLVRPIAECYPLERNGFSKRLINGQ